MLDIINGTHADHMKYKAWHLEGTFWGVRRLPWVDLHMTLVSQPFPIHDSDNVGCKIKNTLPGSLKKDVPYIEDPDFGVTWTIYSIILGIVFLSKIIGMRTCSRWEQLWNHNNVKA